MDDMMQAAKRLFQILPRLFDSAGPIGEGMHAVLADLASAAPSAPWEKLKHIDWGVDAKPAEEWARRALEELPRDAAGIWFEVTEIELNDPQTYAVASPTFDPARNWAVDWTWSYPSPTSNDYLPLRALEEAQRALEIGPQYSLVNLDGLIGVVYAVPMAHVAMTIRAAIAPVLMETLAAARSEQAIVMACGFASGDCVNLCQVTAKGLEPLGAL